MRCIILGGGLSGLACGTTLRMHGHDVVILEKQAELGGLAKCFRVDGYAFDYGLHYLFGQAILPLLQQVFATDLELHHLPGTREKMYFKQKYFNFPFDPKDLLRQMEPSLLPSVLLELIKRNIFLRFSDSKVQENVEDWVVHAVGKRVYDHISLAGYISKLYGLPPTQVSKDWGIQKLKFLSRWRDASLFQLALKALQEERRVKQNVISYPAGGIDAIARNIAATYRKWGGEVLCEAEAVAVDQHERHPSVIFRQQNAERNIEGDFLISTLPIANFVRLLNPTPPPDVIRAANFLRHRTLLLFYLCLNKERALRHASIYFTEPGFPFRRITEFKHLSPTMAPEGKTSLCVEITCFEGDRVSNEDPESLFRVITESLEKGGFLNTNELGAYHFLRVPYAYPVYEVGYASALDTLLSYLGSYDKAVSVGRQGLFFYNLMHNCILQGHQLGEELSGLDRAGWKSLIQKVYAQRIAKYT